MKLQIRRAVFIFLWLFFGLMLLFVDLTIWAQKPSNPEYIYKAVENTFKDGSSLFSGNLYFLSSEASVEGFVTKDMRNKEYIVSMESYPGIAFKEDGKNLFVTSDFFSEVKISHAPLKLSDLYYFKDLLLELTPSRKVIESKDSFGNKYRMASICYSCDLIQLIKLLPGDYDQDVFLKALFLQEPIVSQSLSEDELLKDHLTSHYLSENYLSESYLSEKTVSADTSMKEVLVENVSGQFRMYLGPGPVIEKIELELKHGETIIMIEGRAVKRPNK